MIEIIFKNINDQLIFTLYVDDIFCLLIKLNLPETKKVDLEEDKFKVFQFDLD